MRTNVIGFLLLCATALSACDNARQEFPTAAIEQKAFTQRLCLPSRVTTLTMEEKADLADMVRAAGPLAIDHVGLRASYAHADDKERGRSIRELFVEQGVQRNLIEFVQDGAVPKDTTDVQVCYSRVLPMQCGDWSTGAGPNYENANLPMLGCATANNLAQQTAKPSDLLGTDAPATIDSDRAAVVMDSYKRNLPVVLQEPTQSVTTGGQ